MRNKEGFGEARLGRSGGAEIVVSHARFYWGETGNVNMRPPFVLPTPASRSTVPTAWRTA
jgi:hypothetical protein